MILLTSSGMWLSEHSSTDTSSNGSATLHSSCPSLSYSSHSSTAGPVSWLMRTSFPGGSFPLSRSLHTSLIKDTFLACFNQEISKEYGDFFLLRGGNEMEKVNKEGSGLQVTLQPGLWTLLGRLFRG